MIPILNTIFRQITGIIPLIANFSFMKIMKFYDRFKASSTSLLTFICTIVLMSIMVNDASAQCALACNDKIFVSLDDACMAVIEPNQILESSEMDCMGEVLTVVITDNRGNNYGNTVTRANIGQTLNVSVESDSGNSCWGTLVVEDKNPPPLVCDTLYTSCTGDLSPGSLISANLGYAADVDVPDIAPNAPFDEVFDIEVFGLQNSTINDFNFYISIEHNNLADLAVYLDHPNDGGGEFLLFSGLSAMCNSGMQITIDDDAASTYLDLQGPCENGVVLKGSFVGANSLDALLGDDPEGTWTIRVQDNNVASGGGMIKKLALVVNQSGGTITFPGTGITVLDQDENQFELLGLDPCGPATATYDDEVLTQDCTSPYDRIIRRTWNAQDSSGNISNPCVQLIYVYRNDISNIVFPPDYDGLNGNPGPLSCSDYGTIIPDSTVTGYPSGDICENIQILPYKDKILEVCPGSYKILREWTVLEWCSGDVVTHNQLIKVEDTEGPTILGVEDITISTEVFECFARYHAVKPDVTDDCSDEFTYDISYQYEDILGNVDPNGVFTNTNVEVIDGEHYISFVPVGKTLVKWRITDECDQTSEEIFMITVEDQVPPIAVCDEFTVASIGSEGWAEVAAITFDDGSHDNCEIVKYQARKMTHDCGDLLPDYDNTIFRDTLKFCCNEVNTSIMVEFRVTDSSGNHNTCMVEVKIQDKLPPFIYCPADITLDCFEDYTNLDITGDVIPGIDAIDNCGDPMVEYVDDPNIDQCGEGVVRRTWTATDAQGLKYSCEQIITLIDRDPFTEEDIDWADDYETDECEGSLDVDDLSYPWITTLIDDNCSLAAITYEDQEFYVVQEACEKILRTWTVIDWCTYDPVEQLGIFSDVQILKKKNFIDPIFSNCFDLEIPAYNENCTADINVTIDAFDDCTPIEELEYSYDVDVDNDGIFNFGGEGPNIVDEWATGVYRVRWRVGDKCGNVSTCEQIITVVDKKKPTPYCITNLTTVVMNNNGMVELWARDYDFGSFDNCTAQRDLLFTFNNANPVLTKLEEDHFFKGAGEEATEAEYLMGNAQKWISADNTSGMVFNCLDIPNGEEATINLNMTVWDEEFNYDFCSVILQLQDNAGDACDGTTQEGMAYISGAVATEAYNYVEGVEVNLDSDIPEMAATYMTSIDGQYLFNNLEMNHDYSIHGDKEDDILNGVSTLDLVMIQRHILGVDPFDSPYKIIASDVDNNDRVSSSDIIALRKAILGISSKFPKNQKSWRFVDRNMPFADDQNPFPYEEGITYDRLTEDKAGQDMVAIKIGDVNNNARANARMDVTTRSDKTISLQSPKMTAQRGNIIEMPVYGNMKSLLGFQFTLDYDPGYIKYNGIIPGVLNMTNDHVGTMYEKDGLLTFSWNDVEAQSISEEPLFTLEFEVLENNDSGLELNINSSVTDAEAYIDSETIVGLELIQTEDKESGFALMQNAPNPFTEQTRIDFRIPESTQVVLEITDVSGKVIKRYNQVYPQGYNSIIIRKDEIPATGVLYYTLRAGKFIASKKMVNLR